MKKMRKIKKMKKVVNMLVGVVLIASISGNIVLGSSYTSTKKNEKNLANTLKEIENDYNELQELKKEKLGEICDLYYENKLRQLMDKEEIDYLAFMAWNYKISVNGEEVKAPIVNTRSDVVRITFTESKIVDNLPENIMREGKFILSEETLKDYLTTEFKTEAEIYMNEDGGNRILTYTFRDVEPGDVITVRLGTVLIDRMMLYEKINLQDDKIEIIRNQ